MWDHKNLSFWITVACLLAVISAFGTESLWRPSVYVVRFTETRFVEILQLQTKFRDSWAAAFAVSRPVRTWGHDRVGLEIEAQAAGHAGEQRHLEFNAAVLLRGVIGVLPGGGRVSMAHGLGPSVALSTPRIERERHEETSRRMIFMPFEIAVGDAGRRREIFLRVHHRSGGFDVVTRGGGSNLVGGGVRWVW